MDNGSSKRHEMEEKRKRWMSDREVSLIRDKAVKESREEENVKDSWKPQSNISTLHINSSSKESSSYQSNGAEMFLDKLTEKISLQIRDHVKKEMQDTLQSRDVRESVVQRMESFLQAELNTHTCKICFELMTSPMHTPMLIFPCGHTFCKTCMESHMGIQKSSGSSNNSSSYNNKNVKCNCPYCRTPIDSIAINQSLKELIDQFAKQKGMVEDGKAFGLDDVFGPRISSPSDGKPNYSNNNNNINRRNGTTHSGRGSSAEVSSESESQRRFRSQLQSCEMRFTILKNEENESSNELLVTQKKRNQLNNASTHLSEEKRKLEDKIKLIREEIDLIDKHLFEQQSRNQELQNHESSLEEKIKLLKTTTCNLKAEMEKLALLVDGANLATK